MAPSTAIVISAFMSSTRCRARSQALGAPPRRRRSGSPAGRTRPTRPATASPTAHPASASRSAATRRPRGGRRGRRRLPHRKARRRERALDDPGRERVHHDRLARDRRRAHRAHAGQRAQALLDQRDLGRAVEPRHHERLAALVLAARTGGGRHRRRRPRASSAACERPMSTSVRMCSSSQPVVGPLPLAADVHQPAVAQQAELVAGRGRGDLQQRRQVGDAQLVDRQRVQDARAGGVAQQREGLGQLRPRRAKLTSSRRTRLTRASSTNSVA